MSLKSTPSRYGTVAVAIHWTSALGIVVAFALGLMAAHASDPASVPTLVRGHVVIALAVVALTLLRILWWLVADRRPEPGPGQPRWQQAAAQTVHAALYVLILLMGTSGIATLVASGAVPALFAGTALPDFSGLIPRLAHGIMSKLLLALLAAHVAAALYHQFIRRDRLMARMGIG
jgi:cytochrome b561